MAKLWMYFKKAMLVWGFIWLAIVLVAAAWIFVEARPEHETQGQAEPQKDEGFKKRVGDIELKAVHDEANPERVIISLTRKDTPLVTGYELPTKEFDLPWVEINEADIIPAGDGRYRIVLQGGAYECDQESAHYIWVLDYDRKMSLAKMLTVFGMHEVAGTADRLFANEIVELPAFADEASEQVVIPIELELGKTVAVGSMLSQQNSELMRQHFGKIIDARMSKLGKSGNTALLAKYQAASLALNETLGKRTTIP